MAMGFVSGPKVDWLAGRDEVAVRIPNDVRLLAVLRETGPLFVTSANRHGAATSTNLQQILAQLEGKLDLVIDGGTLHNVPSTLVNCHLEPPVIEREGVVTRAELSEFLEN
jgi:L-threonylcarbamoyladenylate synthase